MSQRSPQYLYHSRAQSWFRDGPGLFQAGETVAHVFVNPRAHKQSDWTIFVGYDVIRGQMTSFDRPSWISHLKLILNQARMLMKSINSWSSANWCRKLEKKLQNYVKTFILVLTYLKFAPGCHGDVKMIDTQMIYQNFQRRWMNRHWKLKWIFFSKIWKKKHYGGWHPWIRGIYMYLFFWAKSTS